MAEPAHERIAFLMQGKVIENIDAPHTGLAERVGFGL